MSLFSGPRPDITPSQLVAMVTAGIPILAALLSAFGVYDLTLKQQGALNDAVTWASIFAAALIGGDAVVRTGRNARKAKVEAVLAEGGEADNLEIVHDVRRSGSPSVTTPPAAQAGPGGGVAGTTFQPTGFEEPPPPK